MKKHYIRFKSDDINFFDEKSNIKNNTVRFTDDWNNIRWQKYKLATHVIIQHKNRDKSFERKIRHKRKYKNIVIITWRD